MPVNQKLQWTSNFSEGLSQRQDQVVIFAMKITYRLIGFTVNIKYTIMPLALKR
jgi:hypothetical protein